MTHLNYSISAATFLSNEGINADLAFGTYQGGQITGYSDIRRDLSELDRLGITQIRTFMTNGGLLLPNGAAPADFDSSGSATLATYEEVAAAGIKFDFIVANGPMTAAQVLGYINLISQIESAYPGSVVGIEGVNESNNNPAITYTDARGVVTSGDAAALAMQQAIYADVQARPNLSGVTVVDYTTNSNFGSALNPSPVTTPGIADVANFHEYADQGYPGASGAQIPYIAEAPNAVDQPVAGAGKTWVTEWGYPLYPGNLAGVTEQVASAYILDTIMDYAQSGTKNFLYGLNEDTNYFGLYYSNGALTAEGQAVANLNAIVKATAGSTIPTINATADLSALTDGNLIQIGNDLIVWAEPELVNQVTGASVYPLPNPINVTIQLGGIYDVSEYNPMTGTISINVTNNVSSITVGVAASPIILHLTPRAGDSTATATAGSDGGGASPSTEPHGTTGDTIPGIGAGTTNTPTGSGTGGAASSTQSPGGIGNTSSAASTVTESGTIVGQPGIFLVTAAGGATVVKLGAGIEQVQALGRDTITAGSGASTIYANTDADPINIIGGGAGSHGTYILAAGTVTEGAGTDQTVTYTGGLNFIGGSGTETLSLYAGSNSVIGGSGDLTVYEAAGTLNTYTFGSAGAGGSITIYGLTSADTINLAGETITGLASLLAHTTYSGGNAVIRLGDGTSIKCMGIDNLGTLTIDYAKTAASPTPVGDNSLKPGGSDPASGTAGTQSNPYLMQGEPGSYITTHAGAYSNVRLGNGSETVTLLGHDSLTSGSGIATVYANTDVDSTFILGGGKGSQGTYMIGSNSTIILSGGTDQVSSYGNKNIFIAGSDSESTGTFAFGGSGNTFTGGSGGASATVYANDLGGNDFIFLAGHVGNTTIYGLTASDVVDVSQYVSTPGELAAAETQSYAGLKLTFANNGGDTNVLLAGVTSPQAIHFIF